MDMRWLQEQVKDRNTDWLQFGNVKARYNGDLVLFNYTLDAEKENRWNWFERAARGLILNWKTGEVVARPFDKFFNYGQRGHYPDMDVHIKTITWKMDGSLGILYRNNGFKIATRGAFDSEQAQWATGQLNTWHDIAEIPDQYTFLFEIIYPDNRIVVDYEGMEELILLAIRDRFTGEYLPFWGDENSVMEWGEICDFLVPSVANFNSASDILGAMHFLDGNREGYVVEYSDGTRWKFKGDRYLELHRLVTNASFNRILEAVQCGTYDEMIANVPDEFLNDIREWKRQIDNTVTLATARIEGEFALAPREDRKTFALWVRDNCPGLSPFMFRKFDGKEYTDLIYKLSY